MKILIVEDEWKTLKGLSNLIAELGGEYEIAGQARSGEEGIRMAMELRPDIIITDIRMNGMTGLEMMKALNEENWPAVISYSAVMRSSSTPKKPSAWAAWIIC